MWALKEGASTLGVDAKGGAIVPARLINVGAARFHPDLGLTFHLPHGEPPQIVNLLRTRLKDALEEAGASSFRELQIPIITDFGCLIRLVAVSLDGFSTDPDADAQYITSDALAAYIDDSSREMFSFLEWLKKQDLQVCFVTPPPATDKGRWAWIEVERTLREKLDAIGVPLVSSLDWAEAEGGGLKEEFASMKEVRGIVDTRHGNAKYGARMLAQCLDVLGIPYKET